jgi:nicotinamidase-related amidase
MSKASTTLREILGLSLKPIPLKESALILIDCQNTYRKGLMQLTNVEPAIIEAKKLLNHARLLKIPVLHIQHDAGPGSPYDTSADIGKICDEVAPLNNETVITKQYPNAFIQTTLDDELKKLKINNLVIAGFMTHMCINSTAHGGFNLGYNITVVASATATRSLEAANGKVLSAQEVQDGAIASTRDLYAAIANQVEEIIESS